MNLPLQPPIKPMLSALSSTWPDNHFYEPKWDGFRSLIFFDGQEIYIQSRDCKPLGRYFPELEEGLRRALPGPIVLDGEIIIPTPRGLDFDALLMRIHPAASRIQKLARETPAAYVAFDLLALDNQILSGLPLAERRARLEQLRPCKPWHITPSTRDLNMARDWFERFEGAGLDGVIAKDPASPYQPDVRSMIKLKHRRSADCVLGGFRWAKDKKGVGSLLLGLYDQHGVLQHVGHTSSFKASQKLELVKKLEPYLDESGDASFGFGRTPGAPSRWSAGKDLSWQSLRPELVCEVSYDHMQGARFRHAATFLRWRPDKPPRDCTYDQLETVAPAELQKLFH
ncbi:ATP-dependent DNA ligase [bacterium]|nr:ATP-dependent DNA ligase [bacterium]